MKIAILGFAGQGQSAYEYWHKAGNEVTVCDVNSDIELPKGIKTKLGDDYLKDLGKFDLLVRTPALHPNDIVAANPDVPDILDRVTTNTNEFFEVCPTHNIIGVTGTKGKGTTSTLITKMLEEAGKTVHLGGNIGVPPLDMLKDGIKPDDWVVLELANFQLIDLKHSPPIAICLMVEPEHLDWHPTIDEYVEAKRQLFKWQTEDNIAIYYADSNYSLSIAQASQGLLIPYMAAPGAEVIENEKGDSSIEIDGQKICDTADIRLLGKHNWQNVCAAVTAVWQVCHEADILRHAIENFTGLPHRLELVRDYGGVRFYNDSFASAPGATTAALEAVPGQKVMIVGGYDRQLELEDLARAFMTHQDEVRRLIVIGQSGKRLEKELIAHGFTNYDLLVTKDINEIVEHAQAAAKKGDAVVLSPGFASFDMFKNFEDRGLRFKDAVNAL